MHINIKLNLIPPSAQKYLNYYCYPTFKIEQIKAEFISELHYIHFCHKKYQKRATY